MKLKFTEKLFVIIFALSLLIVCVSWIGLRQASQNTTLYIADIIGNRQVLENVIIRGVLQDMYHGQYFEIANEETKHQLRFYQHQKEMADDPNDQSLYDHIVVGNLVYVYGIEGGIAGDANTTKTTTQEVDNEWDGREYTREVTTADKVDVYVTVTSRPRSGAGDWKGIRYRTGVQIQREQQEFEFSRSYFTDETGGMHLREENSVIVHAPHAWNFAKAITKSEDLYFTVLTAPEYTGFNGIYRIKEFSNQWIADPDSQYGEVEPVVTWSLENQDTSILGLEAVGDYLILILVKDNMLNLRLYDPQQAILLDELTAVPVDIDRLPGTYQAFIEDHTLNLHFAGGSPGSDPDKPLSIITSIQIEDKKIRLKHSIQGLALQNETLVDHRIHQIAAVDGKLFVFGYVNPLGISPEIPIQVLRPKQYILFVYQGDQLLYKGELVSDSDEDYISDREKNPMSFGYNPQRFRGFYQVTVKER